MNTMFFSEKLKKTLTTTLENSSFEGWEIIVGQNETILLHFDHSNTNGEKHIKEKITIPSGCVIEVFNEALALRKRMNKQGY